ncbi:MULTISPECIES: four helix bundle protein [Butyricimonas]|uniref:four helix bundle protein n=1 Tax=Butyricimonas TaxID=574697 RepID=UPI0007FB3659|nr:MULTISPECIES: four helix bundle protein [Butyricimonas]
MKEENVVAGKSFRFAVRIVNLYKYLCAERKEFVLSKQLLRSGTSIGALIRESEHAQSKADFINKVNIALKEANETEYWLLLLRETEYLTETEFNSIIEECRELIRLTASIVKTTKLNLEN